MVRCFVGEAKVSRRTVGRKDGDDEKPTQLTFSIDFLAEMIHLPLISSVVAQMWESSMVCLLDIDYFRTDWA